MDEGLDSLSAFSCSDELWILTDSRSSIQHLANWHRMRDNTGVNILNKLKSLSASYRIHLQWIPSHVSIQGTRLQMHLLKQVVMMLRCLLHLSPTRSCSIELKAGIELSGSFHRSITGIRVLDQVAVYQLTAADATKQL
ncbi:hypothetical protein AVEN_257981-1 [Araneus ventricosus]|uniref:Uncharacterized protein n=1 Tax=Araneus ventricosus TaxID=182803 RepID=A0A4Y2K829_ARAVE|nr:hypothetical protein AVEN_257981-1 [Araneus ventricosus]